MFRKTHEAEIAEYATDLKRANEARDNWRDSSKEWEAKFKLAATDLAKQAEEIAGLQKLANGLNAEMDKVVHERNAWKQTATTYAEEIAALRHPAQKWRDKLARDRAARKGAGK